ncbi:MAG TPA: DUF4097 family beta strand repeat-containing protein [Blastocatellia bacterium]|nr:DUF4097 family beta strand repeat-containing protein [Blastocatellia bacterium]
MNRNLFHRTFLLLCFSLVTVAALAQDFQKSYRLAQGSRVSIKNVSGDVIVKGYDGEAIVVTGYKEGRDREVVSVEDLSDGSRVDIKVRYPERCNCNASVRFEVKVPRTINYDYDALSSVSGNVEVHEAMGTIRAKSVSGNVNVKEVAGTVQATSVSGDVAVEEASGAVTAKSTSGNVQVNLLRLEGSNANRMEFGSVSGNVEVKMPGSLGANVEMSTMSGHLETDFPITIEKREYGPGRSARGQVGDGARTLKLSTVSGNVFLRRN